MSERVKDFTVNGECSRCCHCCGPLLPLKLREAQKMKELYKTNEYVRSVVDRNCTIIENEHGGHNINLCCPFADLVNRKCSIYEDRPEVCRVFRCHNYNSRDIKNCEQKAYYNHISYYKDYENGDEPKNFLTIFNLLDKGLMHNLYIFFHIRHELAKTVKLAMKYNSDKILQEFMLDVDRRMKFDKYTFDEAKEIAEQSFCIDINKEE